MQIEYNVSNLQKKIWAVELDLLKEFDRVCKKYDLKYVVEYGTLIGAVRHKGYIPWDDDLDVMMFREDYNKLLEVEEEEFKDPYYLQNSHKDPYSIWIMSKLRNSKTTAIEFKDAPINFNQGIFIDIFPLDDVPDGEGFPDSIYDMEREVWATIVMPDKIKSRLDDNKNFLMDKEVLKALINLSPSQRFEAFEGFLTSNAGKSKNVNNITDQISGISKSRKREWYDEIIMLPFEDRLVPAPKEYDKILRASYGDDYMVPKKVPNDHDGTFYDPDTPYDFYMNNKDKIKNI